MAVAVVTALQPVTIDREAAFWASRAGEVEHRFSGACAGKAAPEWEPAGAIGPRSNTGQKGGALVDYLTVVLPEARVQEAGITRTDHLLGTLFGFRGEVAAGAIRDKRWQFYAQSAVLLDREGEMVGRIGYGGNGGTVCVSLSGAGCRWVRNWEQTMLQLERLGGKLSRVDVAFDDYDGEALDVHAMLERARAGDFAQGGRPPRHRFLSDEGWGSGSTLYVGAKGHKELCIYEKGKQLGLRESPWVRAEVRLYAKHCAIPLDVLVRPLDYLRGSYSVLAEVIRGVCSRIKTVRRMAEATGEAAVRWAHRQVGPTLNLLREAFGAAWADFAETRILREGHPGRFKGIAKGARLAELIRQELQTCPVVM